MRRSPPRSFLVFFLIAFIGGGCASTPKYNPFKVPKDEVRTRVKTIALSPLATPADLEAPEPVQAEFERLIQEKLEQGGFSVIPAKEWASIWAARKQEAGGIFDPVTGKRDEAKYNAVRARALQDLREKLHADGIMFPSIRYISVRFRNGMANWDGASEPLSPSVWIPFGQNVSGTVPAYTLDTTLEDSNGRTLFVNFGGIQLKNKLNGAPGVWSNLVPVPRSNLFVDSKRNQGAIDTALNPLAKQP